MNRLSLERYIAAVLRHRWLVAGFTTLVMLALTAGAQNALNQYPEENPNARAVAGNRYSPATPFGASGGFYYVKAGFTW